MLDTCSSSSALSTTPSTPTTSRTNSAADLSKATPGKSALKRSRSPPSPFKVQFQPSCVSCVRTYLPEEPAVLVNDACRERSMSELIRPRRASEIVGLAQRQQIVLEDARLEYPFLVGSIVVKNMTFAKDVFVRISTNKWASFQDIRAEYVGKVGNPLADLDRFRFRADVSSHFRPGARLAVCCHVSFDHQQPIWDNNNSANYVAEMFEDVVYPDGLLEDDSIEIDLPRVMSTSTSTRNLTSSSSSSSSSGASTAPRAYQYDDNDDDEEIRLIIERFAKYCKTSTSSPPPPSQQQQPQQQASAPTGPETGGATVSPSALSVSPSPAKPASSPQPQQQSSSKAATSTPSMPTKLILGGSTISSRNPDVIVRVTAEGKYVFEEINSVRLFAPSPAAAAAAAAASKAKSPSPASLSAASPAGASSDTSSSIFSLMSSMYHSLVKSPPATQTTAAPPQQLYSPSQIPAS